MSRKLASIQEVIAKRPIPGADRIEVLQVLGWEVVAKKDESQVGDRVVYIEIDSKLPDRPEFEFLKPKSFKVKTIRLKNQVSQGIIFPLSILPENKRELEVGSDVTEILEITNFKDVEEIKDPNQGLNTKNKFLKFLFKYKLTRPIANFFTKKKTSGWPSFIVKTDEERIQNKISFYETLEQGKQVYITEKLDGCSSSFYLKKRKFFGFEFGVCSRNLHLKTKHICTWWDIAEKYEIEKKLKKLGREIYIQGEIVGPGIQGNKYNLKERKFFLFNAFDLKANRYLKLYELEDLAYRLGCDTVPVLFPQSRYPVTFTKEEFVGHMLTLSKGFSKLNPKTMREGIVIREDVSTHKNSIKVISPDFLIKFDE